MVKNLGCLIAERHDQGGVCIYIYISGTRWMRWMRGKIGKAESNQHSGIRWLGPILE